MKKILAAVAAAMLTLLPMTAAHAATWHTFWSGEDVGNPAHVCIPSVTSYHPWKIFVNYTALHSDGKVTMARYNDNNGTYAAWVRGAGFYSLSSGYLPEGTYEHACATTNPGAENYGTIGITAQWYG